MKQYLRADQLEARTGFKARTWLEWARRGIIQAIRIDAPRKKDGGDEKPRRRKSSWLFREEDVERWLKERTTRVV